MNPRAAELMRKKLSHWGYPKYLVNRLKPWSLLDCFKIEQRKRQSFIKPDPSFEPAIIVIDSDVDQSLDSSIIDTVIAERIHHVKTPKKYRGIVVKHDDSN